MGSFTKKYYMGLVMIAVLIFIGFQFYRSDKKPDNINEDLYNDALAVINVLDNYLDGSFDISEADTRINKINYEQHVDKENINEWSIGFDIDLLKMGLDSYKSDADIRAARDDLAKKINYKK